MDMDKQKRLHEEVDRTLEMMDRLEDIEAGPYFYTRLESKLHSRDREKRPWLPAVSGILDILHVKGLRPALLMFLIMVNVISALFFLAQSKDTRSPCEEYRSYIAVFVEDYSLDRNTYDTDITDKMTGGSQ